MKIINDTENKIKYFKSDILSPALHFFTARNGSGEAFLAGELNLGFNTKNTDEEVIKNYERLAKAMGVSTDCMVLSKQVHEDIVIAAAKEHKGNGITRPNAFESADALVTNEKGIMLIVFFADCVPVLLFDKEKQVIGAVHSGWKGTAKKIVYAAAKKMQTEYGCKPENIVAAIGPSIGPCHFEAGEDTFCEFQKTYGKDAERLIKNKINDKYYLDLKLANVIALSYAGVPHKNIDCCDICTVCEMDICFSHRGECGNAGRMAAGIML